MQSMKPSLFPTKSDNPKKDIQVYSPLGSVPSLLKWTGSKRSQALRIASYAPHYKRYFEPFLGGGSMMFLLAKEFSVGGDIFEPLIHFWEMVRDNPAHLVKDYAEQWKELQDDLPGYFYIVRDRFNLNKRPEDLNFLMRTCVNGIVRFNSNGDFNNSFHLSRKGMKPQTFEGIVNRWSDRIQKVEFRSTDFESTVEDARSGDFVYLDPPYGGNKQRYIGDLDIERFFNVLEQLNKRGVKWALSFDGSRGETQYNFDLPASLYKKQVLLKSGHSAVSKVLNGPIEEVTESLYLNYQH